MLIHNINFRGEPFPLYTVSYVYYPVIGALTVIVIGLVVSFITGPNKPSHMDPDLFSPVIQKYLKTEYDIVEEIKLMKKRVRHFHLFRSY